MGKQFDYLLPEHENFIRKQRLFFVGSAPLSAHFELLPGARQIILITLHKVQTSCGFAVPNFSYIGERETLQRWAIQKGEEGLRQYQQDKNSLSLDGLPTPLGTQSSS